MEGSVNMRFCKYENRIYKKRYILIGILILLIGSLVDGFIAFRGSDPPNYLEKAEYIWKYGYSVQPTGLFGGIDIHPPLYFYAVLPVISLFKNYHYAYAVIELIVGILTGIVAYKYVKKTSKQAPQYVFLALALTWGANAGYELGAPRGLSILFIVLYLYFFEKQKPLSMLFAIAAMLTSLLSMPVILIYTFFEIFLNDRKMTTKIYFAILSVIGLLIIFPFLSFPPLQIKTSLWTIFSYQGLSLVSTFAILTAIDLKEKHSLTFLTILFMSQLYWLGLNIGGSHVWAYYLLVPSLFLVSKGLTSMKTFLHTWVFDGFIFLFGIVPFAYNDLVLPLIHHLGYAF